MAARIAPRSDPAPASFVFVTVSASGANWSTIVTVAELPSAEKIAVSGPSTSALTIGVKVTVAVVWPAGMRTVKPPGADVTSVGLLMV